MSPLDGSEALQAAVFERCNGQVFGRILLDGSESADPIPLYDAVPEDGTVKPYVVHGDADGSDWGDKDDPGKQLMLTFDVYSEYRGKREAKRIAGSLFDRIDRKHRELTELTAPAGFRVVLVIFDSENHDTEGDGLTRRSTLRYKVLLQKRPAEATSSSSSGGSPGPTPPPCPIGLSPPDGAEVPVSSTFVPNFPHSPGVTGANVYLLLDGSPAPGSPFGCTFSEGTWSAACGFLAEGSYTWFGTYLVDGVESEGCAAGALSVTIVPEP